MTRTWHDFFAGGGMARLGLGPGWSCTFANDRDPMKAAAYRANHGGEEFLLRDVAEVSLAELPGRPDLVWASFPCQDLSLAGAGQGLRGGRSGAFHPFWRLVQGLAAEGRAPGVIVLENVCGLLTSNGGSDFAALVAAFRDLGWRTGAVVIDAALFVPQSRPRLFFVGVPAPRRPPSALVTSGPDPRWHPASLTKAAARLPPDLVEAWTWWSLPTPPRRNVDLASILEVDPADAPWRTPAETERLLAMMSPTNRIKVETAQAAGGHHVGALFRRTRLEADGVKRQRIEVRLDGLAGCLRTPAGGSSRQSILVVEDGRVRVRLLSPREAASLMGLLADYITPRRTNDALKLAGDGVVVPVVRFLAENLLEPLAEGGQAKVLLA
ncbi:DNA cytosine methyltransferase [Albimonas sp. CAU 1670]|uniref:DNA cytosine methyltransferase n=1 Tax=Albimonas sp. CAU 1670 TaxID=3032599 RepID=UPI0023DBCCB1|nr:DNA cytosine methyltransferase [Albimonas sp. CAU 1670]MDF2235750.1 DNA cytosine methyltransferase [Albimonas sp. CAU 1670]